MPRDSYFRKPSLFVQLDDYTDLERQLASIANNLGNVIYANIDIFNALLDSGLIRKKSVSSLGIVKWTLKDIEIFLTKLTGFNCKVIKRFFLPPSLRYRQYAIGVYWSAQGMLNKHTFFIPSCASQETKNSIFAIALFKYCYFIQFYDREGV